MQDIGHGAAYSDGEVDTNSSDNPTLNSIIDARYSRRQTLFSGLGVTAAAVFSTGLLAACDGEDKPDPTISAGANGTSSSGRIVTLAGVADAGDFAQVGWTQKSGPPVALSSTTSANATFLAPSVSTATPLVFQFTGVTPGGRGVVADTTITVDVAKLDFTAVAKNQNDVVTVPAGYTVSVLFRLGDPINSATPAYANNGTDTGFAGRAGDHHDALYFYGLAASGNGRDDNNSSRGVLVMNHENITQRYLHPNGPTNVGGTRPESEAIKEMEAHGVANIEVVRGANGTWTYVQNSPLNGRITPLTPVVFTGPARADPLLQTLYSPTGVGGRGTINNCANGFTYWGTNITCEENWAGYFRRRTATDNPQRSAKELIALARYGVNQAVGNFGWATVIPSDPANTIYSRWTSELAGVSPTADFRNESNQFGWVIETDPYNPAATPRKRTALGRFNHEGAWPSNFASGRRPAFYMGDDARGEYIYKFVSAAPWDPADAQKADRLAVGDKYLDNGTLYVARFDASGSGSWLPLTFGAGPLTPANAAYPFASQADVVTHARLAGDALGATKMDRPEWTATNPKTGEVYITLTNNSAALRPLAGTDAANPRHYNDPRSNGAPQFGNPNGHILRLREAGDSSEATTFIWDIYAFGAGSDLGPNANLSGLDGTNDFSSPDGLWFARPTNASGLVNPVLWIQTDDSAFTDVTNNQMLAAMPGVTQDGAPRTVTNADATGATRTQSTIVGANPGARIKRFMVGPKECEITGVDSTPDGRALFVNIQHPGEETVAGFPATFPSNWPASQTNPAAVSRPRSATVVITREDGGVVGLS